MSNYTPVENYGAKDLLAPGNPEKTILGADIDAELAAIQTAVNSKINTSDIASQAQAEAGTSNAVVMTPLRTQNWAEAWALENAGMLADLQILADPGADRLMAWDFSAGALVPFTIGSGLTVVGTTLSANSAGTVSTSRLVSAGTGLTGGGDLSADRTLSLSHLGLEALTDPGDDRLFIWDDSAGVSVLADVGDGIQITAAPLITLDLAGLGALTAAQIAPSADYAVVLDATDSLHKKALVQDLVAAAVAIPVKKYRTAAATRASDSLVVDTEIAAMTLEAGTAYAVEGCLVLECDSATVNLKMQITASQALFDGKFAVSVLNGSVTAAQSDYNADLAVDLEQTSPDRDVVHVIGTIVTGATPPIMALSWAQGGTSAGNPLSLEAGSWLRFTKLVN